MNFLGKILFEYIRSHVVFELLENASYKMAAFPFDLTLQNLMRRTVLCDYETSD